MAQIKLYPIEYYICKNIINYCKYRNYELVRDYEFKVDGKIVLPESPITFYAKKDGLDYQIIYIPDNSTLYKKAEFVKVAKSNHEIIVVKNPAKKIKYPAKELIEFPSEAFYINHGRSWTERGQICRKVSDDILKKYCHLHKMTPEMFPRISPTSIEAIWGGLHYGDVVETTTGSICSAGLITHLHRVADTKIVSTEDLVDDQDLN